MSNKKAPFFLRLRRLFRLSTWLFQTGRNLRRIDGNNPAQRNQAVLTLGRDILKALDIELEIATPPEQGEIQGTLVASNHISWLDIFAMSAVYPSSFIAKQEISTWPVLGQMGKNAGTVFINRNSRRDVEPINQAIGVALKAEQNVSFFPEARTSSGLTVLPLKAALFQSAIDSRSPVQIIALRYYDEEGKRSDLPSYADVSLPVSLWNIVSMPKIRIKVDFAPVFNTAEHADTDRYALKDIAETFIKNKVSDDL